MSSEWECMCMACGISIYLTLEGLTLDDDKVGDLPTLKNVFCPECGGTVSIVGKAGDQPYYEVP